MGNSSKAYMEQYRTENKEQMKRYNIYTDDVCYDDGHGEYCPLIVEEDEEGDWVKWEDMKDKINKYSEEEIEK